VSLEVPTLMLLWFCPWVSASSLSAFHLERAEQLLQGEYADGQVSDVMMENRHISVVISNTVPAWYAASKGNVIDVARSCDRLDFLAEMHTYFDDDWPRQAVYDTLTIEDDGSSCGPAVVRVTGRDSSAPALEVMTEYSLAGEDDYLAITTTITNNGSDTWSDFELGDALVWGLCSLYTPEYGYYVEENTFQPWLIGTSQVAAYGYGSGDSERLRGVNGYGWSDVNIKTVSLEPGESASYERFLVVGGRDMGPIVSEIHELSAVTVGELCAFVSSDGLPVFAAEIDVYDSRGAPYLRMVTDYQGRSCTTLPPGEWRLAVSALGFELDSALIDVSQDVALEHQFELISTGASLVDGDSLTIIQRPLLNIPALATPGSTIDIECRAASTTSGWTARLAYGSVEVPLRVTGATYEDAIGEWLIRVLVPDVPLYVLYDLYVSADGVEDMTRHGVSVIPEFKEDFYFVHLTDTHLPTHLFLLQAGAVSDTSEEEDFLAVIDDINLINPEFVLLTGDLLNEGELEEFLGRHYFSRAQQLLTRFEVPVFLVAGNHDIGGWPSTAPPAGTARQDWWRFFGWERLADPPSGSPRTQDYSFDYGSVHFVGLESYDNYDDWMPQYYGEASFTAAQLDWLQQDLTKASQSNARVLFYHYDFSDQLDLQALGVEMGLWGHIHRDEGSISQRPFDLSTNNISDGERSYRMVRVVDGELFPSRTVTAGHNGDELVVTFSPGNDGTHTEVKAKVVNRLEERFDDAQLKFVMPRAASDVEVTGGTLRQTLETEETTVYFVSVDLQPDSSQTVIVEVNLNNPEGCHCSSGQGPKKAVVIILCLILAWRRRAFTMSWRSCRGTR
jgi:hypothetical protein